MPQFTFDCIKCGAQLITENVAEVLAFDQEHPCFVEERKADEAGESA